MFDALAHDWSPSLEAAQYWAAARERRLELPRCAACGAVQHPSREVCESCGGAILAYEAVAGGGSIYTFTVVERALIPELRLAVPYALALVDLDVGPRVLSIIRGYAMDEIRIGMRVNVQFEEVTPELTLPVFVPEV